MDDRQLHLKAREAAQGFLRRERVLAAAPVMRAGDDGPVAAKRFLLVVTDRHIVALGVHDHAAQTPRIRREIARWPLGGTHVVAEPAPERPLLRIAPAGGPPVAVTTAAGDAVSGTLMALGVAA